MQPGKKRSTIGCLMINDLMSEERQLSGLSVFLGEKGIYARHFAGDAEKGMYARIQTAFQKIREQSQRPYIIAFESGCWAALALAAQLSVEKMVLINAGKTECGEPSKVRRINRIAGFAKKNAAFCVGEVLVLSSDEPESRKVSECIAKDLCNGRVWRIGIHGSFEKELCINRESEIKMLIYAFLNGLDLTKFLAEKSELCIIYE